MRDSHGAIQTLINPVEAVARILARHEYALMSPFLDAGEMGEVIERDWKNHTAIAEKVLTTVLDYLEEIKRFNSPTD